MQQSGKYILRRLTRSLYRDRYTPLSPMCIRRIRQSGWVRWRHTAWSLCCHRSTCSLYPRPYADVSARATVMVDKAHRSLRQSYLPGRSSCGKCHVIWPWVKTMRRRQRRRSWNVQACMFHTESSNWWFWAARGAMSDRVPLRPTWTCWLAGWPAWGTYCWRIHSIPEIAVGQITESYPESTNPYRIIPLHQITPKYGVWFRNLLLLGVWFGKLPKWP